MNRIEIEEVKKQIKEALWMAYCSGRANNKYIPEEVLPDLLKRCQLFPQPLPDKICPKCKGQKTIEVGVLRGGVFKGKHIECPECEGKGILSYKKSQPLDDEGLREKALLLEEIKRTDYFQNELYWLYQRHASDVEALVPEKNQDSVRWIIQNCFGKIVTQAQRDADHKHYLALLQPKIEEAKLEMKMAWVKALLKEGIMVANPKDLVSIRKGLEEEARRQGIKERMDWLTGKVIMQLPRGARYFTANTETVLFGVPYEEWQALEGGE